jgi:hypothetical protein
MEVKTILLSEKIQTQEDKYFMFSLVFGNRVILIEEWNGISFTKYWEGRGEELQKEFNKAHQRHREEKSLLFLLQHNKVTME